MPDLNTRNLDPLACHSTRLGGDAFDRAVGVLAPLLGIDVNSPEAMDLRQQLIDLPSPPRALSPALANISDPTIIKRTMTQAVRKYSAAPSGGDDANENDWLAALKRHGQSSLIEQEGTGMATTASLGNIAALTEVDAHPGRTGARSTAGYGTKPQQQADPRHSPVRRQE